jgi:hypothetical protein
MEGLMSAEETPVTTVELGMAAWLYALGHPVTVTDVPNTRNQKQFEFPAAAAADIGKFYANGAISASAYYAALRDVKAVVFQPTQSSRKFQSPNSNPEVRPHDRPRRQQ